MNTINCRQMLKPNWKPKTVHVREDREKLILEMLQVTRQTWNGWITSLIDEGLPKLAAKADRRKAEIGGLVNRCKMSRKTIKRK